MKVTLHMGAHRCATTSFQYYLRGNSEWLARQGLGFWGPLRTRTGLMQGILPVRGQDLPTAAFSDGMSRLRRGLEQASGLRGLIVSDENFLGTMRANLRLGELYPGAGERAARLGAAFGDRLGEVMLNIRATDDYWASALGWSVARGHGLPRPRQMVRLASASRSWRDVITEMARALPGVRLSVLPFEVFAGRPDAQLACITGGPAPSHAARGWRNATPPLEALRAMAGPDGEDLPPGTGRWMPFDEGQRAALREGYADDLMWLTAGADGLARLVWPNMRQTDGDNPATQDMTRGRRHDRRHIEVARAGREGAARQAG